MRIFFDNVNIDSSSGPNSFAKKLKLELERSGNIIDLSMLRKDKIPDIQLSFIASQFKIAPLVQRLDGIYFNSEQDFSALNAPIEKTYKNADAVIFQSSFNKKLTYNYFGKKEFSTVIRNGTDLEAIYNIPSGESEVFNKYDKVWTCASSWRPHKRLNENIRYFLERSDKNDCLVVAGENPDNIISDPRVLYAGSLVWEDLISLYKRSKYFIHLAWLDHCPNVVVDARASGCHIICSSAGGTKEIAGKNSTIILEDEWDFSPTKLYSPPKMNFSKLQTEEKLESDLDIADTCKKYINVFQEILS